MTATLTRHFNPTQLRGVNRDARTVDIVASDFSLDSYGTRIDPNGWDLEQFRKNPVICLQHDSYSGLPVAAAISETIRVEGGKLVMTVQFPPLGTSTDADEAFGLIAAGILRGVSVGFDPAEWEDTTERLADGQEIRVRVYKKQRLMETSFVTIPSNDNGMVVRARELNADESQIRTMTERLESSLKDDKIETEAREKIRGYKASYLADCLDYMERKQPANKASTRFLKKFYKARDQEIPQAEVEAWEKAEEMIGTVTEIPATDTTVTDTTSGTLTIPLAPEPPPEPSTPPPAPEAPEPERTASVHVPLTALMELPATLARNYTEAAIAALRQGIPARDVDALVDGLNRAAVQSLSTQLTHGNHN